VNQPPSTSEKTNNIRLESKPRSLFRVRMVARKIKNKTQNPKRKKREQQEERRNLFFFAVALAAALLSLLFSFPFY